MKTRRTITTLLVLVAMTLTFFAGYAYARQWRMIDARNNLNQALNYLQAAEQDKAGHRVQAINYTKQAITQVNEGIAAGR